MDKVAIYCRLSDEDRNKSNKFDESESIQNQKNILTKYAIEQGWNIYNIYSDDDFSGLDSERPEFNRMIKDAQMGRINIILAKTQARFTRDMELVEKYLHKDFVEWGIRFVGFADFVDTNQKGNKKARQINGLVNEWYCEDISASIRTVFNSKREDGDFIGSFATYGYKKDPDNKHKLIIDEDAAEVVKLIFDLYLQGNGTQHIAYILNERGIPNPSKYKQLNGEKFVNSSQKDSYGLWNKTTVKRMLTNEMYLGHMQQRKREKVSYKTKKIRSIPKEQWIVVKNTHEPIIDEKTFFTVQNRLRSRARSTGTGKTHIFATKLKCMDCGATMSRVKASNGYAYLRCQTYARFANKNLCSSHSIRFDMLEEFVLENLKRHFENLDEDNISYELEFKENNQKKNTLLEKQLKQIEKQIDEIDNTVRSLYLDKVKEIIQESQFIELNEQFINEKEDLIKKQKNIQVQINTTTDKDKIFKNWKEITSKYKNIDALNHVIVTELINNIEIGEKNQKGEQKIKIHWLF